MSACAKSCPKREMANLSPCSDASKQRKPCQVAERPIDFPAVFGILSGRDSNL